MPDKNSNGRYRSRADILRADWLGPILYDAEFQVPEPMGPFGTRQALKRIDIIARA